MRILQAMPTFFLGDAVGNHAQSLMKVIAGMGFDTAVYAQNISDNVPPHLRNKIEALPPLTRDDVMIYHQSIGTDMAEQIAALPCRKILVYHNVTPPHYFCGYSSDMAKLTTRGLADTRLLLNCADAVWADSDFNRRDLLGMGYDGQVSVLPILIPFEDYEKTPDDAVMKRYNDGIRHILFVGRVAPNKKQEDILAAFAYYQKNINAYVRLTLVGPFNSGDPYAAKLKAYIRELGLYDARLTGQVSFAEILAYYRTADAFLCLSEHEGFCVPLLEAMWFDVPVLAFDAAAVGDTLCGSGVLLPKKDPVFVALALERVLSDAPLRERIILGQRERLSDFAYDKVSAMYRAAIRNFWETCK